MQDSMQDAMQNDLENKKEIELHYMKWKWNGNVNSN